jgi:hypothetical protein
MLPIITDTLQCKKTGPKGNKTWTFKAVDDPTGLQGMGFTIERQPSGYQATGAFVHNGHSYKESFDVKWVGPEEGLCAHGQGENELGSFSVALWRMKNPNWFFQKTYVGPALKPKPINTSSFWKRVKKRNQEEALALAEEIQKGRKRKREQVKIFTVDEFGPHSRWSEKRPRSLSVSDVAVPNVQYIA